jgi:hypothetical protein
LLTITILNLRFIHTCNNMRSVVLEPS